MTGFPSLQEMVSRELARRADANASRYAPERVTIDDDDPDGDAKIAAVQARHPNKIVVVHRMVDSPLRHSPPPDVGESTGTGISPAARIDDDAAERAADAAQRAAARLTALRGL